MFINPEGGSNAIAILRAGLAEADRGIPESELAGELVEVIRDALNELLPKPHLEFDDIGSAVESYVAYRDMLSVERKAWEDHERDIKGQMEIISMWLRDRGDELGVDSFNTAFGTAYRNVKHSYRIEDWDTYARWILETDNLQCLEKRPAKLAVKEIHDETGEIPPGLYQQVEVEFNVRRPTKKGSS